VSSNPQNQAGTRGEPGTASAGRGGGGGGGGGSAGMVPMGHGESFGSSNQDREREDRERHQQVMDGREDPWKQMKLHELMAKLEESSVRWDGMG